VASSDRRLTRREILVSGAAAAGYALAARPVAADPIRTAPEGLVTGSVSIPGERGPVPAWRARPEGEGPFPVVLVVHEIFGVHEYIRDVCRRLAHEGWLAVAPDLYHRHGDVSELESVDAILEQVVRRVPDAEVLADLDATLAWAGGASGDADRAGITGFCWGGRIVWLYAAHQPRLRAGVAWYGRLTGAERPETPRHPIDVAGELHAPVLGLYGEADAGIPLDSVAAMRRALHEADGESEILLFPGAPHGFHADYRPSYRELAAQEGWRRLRAWLRENGAG